MMLKISSFGFLVVIMASMIFVLESPDIHLTFGTLPNPNCALATKDANLHGLDLSSCDLSNANLHNANLKGANLQNANLKNVNLSSANLSNANLKGANLQNANLKNVNLSSANLSNANLNDANLQNANLKNANLSSANLSNANLKGANLKSANLTGTNLAKNVTSQVTPTSTVLLDDNLNNTNLSNANLNNANLTSTDQTSTDQTSTDQTSTNLDQNVTSQVTSTSTVLLDDNLNNTNLSNANLNNANLTSTDQTSTDQTSTDQTSTDQTSTDQTSTDQTSTDQTSTNLDQNVTSQVTSTSTDLSTLPSTIITSPSFSDTTFNQWITSFSATIVNNVNSTSVNSVEQTPQVIIVGTQNSTAIDEAINSQSSISLNATFAPLTNGSTIINAMGLENYSLLNSTDVVSVIPTILAKVNDTTDYVIATPPFSEIIPGQQMVIPVTDSLIPSFGGLKEIDVQSSPTAKPIGEKNAEWLVAEVDNKIPSSINSDGIDGTPVLFLNIQHPFEESGSGFNWSDPSNHAVPPLLTLVINKETSDDIQIDSEGCPIVIAYTLISDSWTTTGVTEISSKSISSSQCEIIIQSQHLSKFAFSLQHLSSLSLSGTGIPSSSDTRHSTTSSYVQSASALEAKVSDTINNNGLNFGMNLANSDQSPNLEIPLWVKDNAQQWHDGKIDDSNFALGVQYMIKQNIIKTPQDLNKDTPVDDTPSTIMLQVPSWVKNNAYWWSQGQITDYDYVNGIQWLISNQIITTL